MTPRSAPQRKADTLAMLGAPAADTWVASAGPSDGATDGDPARAHLVPLSLAWIDERVVIALASDSRTAHNIVATGSARLGVGPTRDVVMIDAVLERAVPLEDAPAALADRYAAQADWDPRQEPGGYLYLVLRPERIQAWREADELPGRTLMRGGRWLV